MLRKRFIGAVASIALLAVGVAANTARAADSIVV